MPLAIPSALLARLYAHCEAAYPEEACGILTGPEGEAGVSGVHPCTNIQNRLHAEDPVAHRRDARTAYLIEPAELFALTRECREGGRAFRAIFHSHVDAGAYFSAEDQRQAAPFMTLSVAAFARSEGVAEALVRERLAQGELAGDAAAGRVTARMPVYPELVYIVVDVTGGRARGHRAFVWDARKRDYVPSGEENGR